jgi:hypothetical protein
MGTEKRAGWTMNLNETGRRNHYRYLKRWFAIVVLTMLFFATSWEQSAVWAQNILKGQVQLERRAEPVDDMMQGQILDARTGKPIPDANVTLPDVGYSMRTNERGEYQIPRSLGKHATIMSVEKQGYVPFSMSITEQGPPFYTIKLHKQQEALVLDNQLRHLGDGSFSRDSSNAMQFRKPPDGPAIRIPFSIEGFSVSDTPYLKIGSILGLDTAMAHFLSGNTMGVSASPLLIKVNGTIISRVHVNGDNQKIMIPKSVLRTTGTNILEIEAGFHYPEPTRIDYDDMELMHLIFYP